MRFAALNIERYGHFEAKELKFRSGEPDLHVIHGSNEAGKTTSLHAISDFLFGFPMRSPSNFMFDYPLLRIGAVVEDGGETFAFRRKKGTTGTLIDDDDRTLDEAKLNAMLRGLDREGFNSSFSLTQEGLRAGGQAMIEARDDVGQALFAAGSGLVGVAAELKRLEEEADAIWGPRRSARRSFTQAETKFNDSIRLMRETSLKPKSWLDAKAAMADAEIRMMEIRKVRDDLMLDVREAERLRRIAPTIQLRAGHISDLASHEGTIDVSPARDEAAITAIAAAVEAEQDIATAKRLSDEIRSKLQEVVPATEFLDHADRIGILDKASSVIAKTSDELAGIQSDRKASCVIITRLRGEVGGKEVVPPTRPQSARLRQLAAAHADDAAALKELAESEDGLVKRKEALEKDVYETVDIEDLNALIASVDRARAIGSDADDRCIDTKRKADNASVELERSLARLSPWNGDIAMLLSLPVIAQEEIDTVRDRLAELEQETDEDRKAAVRANEAMATVAMEIESLTAGAAVSHEDIDAAREKRTEAWIPIRDHVMSGAPLPSPDGAIGGFEAAVDEADMLGDRRYATAEESSRLMILERAKTTHEAEAENAASRAQNGQRTLSIITDNWFARLTGQGFPALLPTSLNAWLAQRDKAIEAYRDAESARHEAERILARRDECRSDLNGLLGTKKQTADDQDLSPLLMRAEKLRSRLEQEVREKRQRDKDLAQATLDLNDIVKRKEKLEGSMTIRSKEWGIRLTPLRVSFDMTGAATLIDVLDELRDEEAKQADLISKADGMQREITLHDERVVKLARVLDIKETGGPADILSKMVSGLSKARADATSRSTLAETLEARESEAKEAEGRLLTAERTIEPLMEETGAKTRDQLVERLEASRSKRATKEAIVQTEETIVSDGDGFPLDELLAKMNGIDFDRLATRAQAQNAELKSLNERVDEAVALHGDARRTFDDLETAAEPAAGAAAEAEQSRAEMTDLAEQYILKRAQAVTLRWAIERYRDENQDPLLVRASELFSKLTVGRYSSLQIDTDGKDPRLLGLRDDGRTVVDVEGMSEGTTDQLFLALRLAAVERSVRSGTLLPFLADDLFVNFDEQRSEAGLRVLAELARSTQVLFFTHHRHLADIALKVVGADKHSLCSLD